MIHPLAWRTVVTFVGVRSRVGLAAFCLALAGRAQAAAPAGGPASPSLEERAGRLADALSLDEAISLLHGPIALPFFGGVLPKGAIGSIGFVPGVPRLGIPALQETDAGLGIANPMNVRPGDEATALPSGLALAASFDPEVAYAAGAMLGREAASRGFNVLLAGGVNLMREPRNGRNFEYLGEDPLLSGTMAAETVRGVQDQHVICTVKHFPTYPQETGGHVLDVRAGEAALRESDLLAFEIAIKRGHPGAVMCSYAKVNGSWACENSTMLQGVLKGDWAYPGWVMSDWGATHSVAAATRGLDQESGEQADLFDPATRRPNGQRVYFDQPLKEAVLKKEISRARVADMDRRILYSMLSVGLMDPSPARPRVDLAADAAVAERVERSGLVLLSNPGGLLPLAKTIATVAVIGGEADVGVISGGGSSQVNPVGGPGRVIPLSPEQGQALYARMVFDPSSPLRAIRAKAANAKVSYDDGRYPSRAAALARGADVAVVFVTQWLGGQGDAPDLTLPSGQDALVAAVAAANPRTVVVLETGGPVLTPWVEQAGAVLEAWYPGARGGEAIADVLFGDADPSGRLPVSFPASETQLPRPTLPGQRRTGETAFALTYEEGSDVGYRWYSARHDMPRFPFGHGLSYARFAYGGLEVTGGETLKIGFEVANVGDRSGVEVPQVYLDAAPGGARRLRLLGWKKLALAPGERRRVVVEADPRLLGEFDPGARRWRVRKGLYGVAIGASSRDLRLHGETDMEGGESAP